MDLLGEAIQVAYGEAVPQHTRAEYEAEMARLVLEEANDEAVDYVIACAALCATSDQRLDCLYKAAAIAEVLSNVVFPEFWVRRRRRLPWLALA